jgi:spore photoproduct lyase
MWENLKQVIEDNFHFLPNKNQIRDIERLVFEIMRRENISVEDIIRYLKKNPNLKKYDGRNRFIPIKASLIKRRFPLTSEKERIDTKRVFLTPFKKYSYPLYKLNTEGKEPLASVKGKETLPVKVVVEKEVKNSYLLNNIKKRFINMKIEEVNYYSEYLKREGFSIGELKNPIFFITKEKWDFLKKCPCTKYHLPCNYWIFNLGFGCPFDCSYCFLQQYTNFPGIILPGNLDDFFDVFDKFIKKIKMPIRIGTGEFCDSLALDDITEYSEKLISYFRDKNVLFELKTKSNNINNLLKTHPSPNIIISWSLNPEFIIEREEVGTVSLKERLESARKVQVAGYRCGFHFDPIIHFEGWEAHYKKVIENLYSYLDPPFAWISLGTLRCNRELKKIVELRFPQSNIFYGELFLGEDKKLRYPKFLRKEIYESMVKWLRAYDKKTPLYLCMESKDIWNIIGDFNSAKAVENYILQL